MIFHFGPDRDRFPMWDTELQMLAEGPPEAPMAAVFSLHEWRTG
jgi:hypothetical protein